MASNNSDFVSVQLSAAGIAAAGGPGGALRITVARMSYRFTPGEQVRVLTSEWSKVLSKEQSKGEPIFEIAPPADATEEATQTIAKEGN